MFLQASVILSTGREYLTRYLPGTKNTPIPEPGTSQTRYTPQDQVQPPWDQVHPLEPARYTPKDQLPSPWTRYTPGTRYTPRPGTPPWTRYTPQDQVHPPGPGIPPGTRYTPWDQVHTPRDQVHPLDQVHPHQVHPPIPGTPPGTEHAGRYGQRAGGTHPTGMQSCLANFFPKTAWR